MQSHVNFLFCLTCNGGLQPDVEVEVTIQWASLPTKCLDVEGGKNEKGVNVVMWDCHSGNNKKQFLVPERTLRYIRWAAHPEKCLDVPWDSTTHGVELIMWECGDNNPNRKWSICQIGTGLSLGKQIKVWTGRWQKRGKLANIW